MPTTDKKKNIINAHTHVFTGNFVPPYLAKTILPWPFYYLIHTGWMMNRFKAYHKRKNKKRFGEEKYNYRQLERTKTKRQFYISKRWYLKLPLRIIGLWLSVVAALFFLEFLASLITIDPDTIEKVEAFKKQLSKYYLYYELPLIFKIVWVVVVIWFVKWSRKLILFILKSFFPLLKKLLSKNTLNLIDRYYLLGRFAFYEKQSRVASRALSQLPPDSSIVILPMDMEYMGAGKTKLTKGVLDSKPKLLKKGWTQYDFSDVYKYQMRELWDFIKETITKEIIENGVTTEIEIERPKEAYYPFLFVDPRRVAEEGASFFNYTIKNNKMSLGDCFVKTYMEDRNFSGFKIYPALGYYPFDEHLLPIWRYASENNIPIMTHCVHGTIFYRGAKQKEWNFHPVFKEKYTMDGEFEPQLLPQAKNVDFQNNFTHPLNYLCLVEEKFLKIVIQNTAENSEVRQLFGYSEEEDSIQHNLSNLKVCLAHYGGEEEWTRYMEQDRQNYSQRLMRNPEEAINFMTTSGSGKTKGKFSWYKINDLWNKADWYSIICSMMIDYENIYADLSYIISKPSIYPLLQYTLEKSESFEAEHKNYLAEPSVNKKATHYTGKNKLRSRVLFGTDFYVVRNHKSDKDLFIETKAVLDEESFDLIARENTHNYLSRS